MTLLIMTVTLFYATFKMIDLINAESPIISYQKKLNRNDTIDMEKEGVDHIAFAVRDFVTKKPKNDPNHVEWEVKVYEGDGASEKAV